MKIAPTYRALGDTQDAYLDHLQMRSMAKKYGRFWAFHSIPTTVALPNNRYAKSLKAFTSHTTEASFRELLREYSEYGCPRPGGYADVFHEKYQSPRVQWSVNALLAPVFAGGWQEALCIGNHRGVYYKYDMRSAYLWAATLGLPDTRTYTRSIAPWKRPEYEGVFRIRLVEPSPGAPFPFNRAHECLATKEEIELYNLRISEVVDGVIWKRSIETRPLIEAIQCVTTWKQAARAYWGRWAQMEKLECVAHGKKWRLPNFALNIPWAHMIVSRVRMRLWQHSEKAVHVFVDSVITPEVLDTGNNLGDWKLEKVYPAGVLVQAPGRYGDPREAQLERAAGIPKNSPLRNLSATQFQAVAV